MTLTAAVTLDLDAIEAIARRAAELLAERDPVGSEPWIDVAGAAEHLACAPRRVYDLVQQRRLPFAKDGSRLLFRRSELDAALERLHPVSTPPAKPVAKRKIARPPVAKTGGLDA